MSKCAKIHGVVTSVSPMKLSVSGKSRYFDGELSDGKRKVRVVGFDSKVREKLFDSLGKREPVVVSNCEVKSGKYSSDLEIFVKKSTELQKSTTKFYIADSMFVTISEIPNLGTPFEVSSEDSFESKRTNCQYRKSDKFTTFILAEVSENC